MKKPVTQEHPMGCAIACTAYALDCTYQQALKFYENPQNAWGAGFYCQDIVIAMLNAGRLYQYKQISILKDNVLNVPDTIIFIEKAAAYPEGHFLVRTFEGSWMNPWINFPLITPAQSGFQSKLPGNPTYVVFSAENGT